MVATGEALMPGTGAPSPGAMLSLNGFGGAFNSRTPIRSVEHLVSEGVWRTSLRFGPAAALATPATALSDAFGNAITLDQRGITLSTTKNLRIEAVGALSIGSRRST